jgi:hypothetical protein
MHTNADFGDLDGDGRADLLLTRSEDGLKSTVEVRSGRDMTTIAKLKFPPRREHRAVAVPDVDGDGRSELLVLECLSGIAKKQEGCAYLVSLPKP